MLTAPTWWVTPTKDLPSQTAEKVVLVFRVTQFAFFTLFCSVVKYYELIVVLVFGGSS